MAIALVQSNTGTSTIAITALFVPQAVTGTASVALQPATATASGSFIDTAGLGPPTMLRVVRVGRDIRTVVVSDDRTVVVGRDRRTLSVGADVRVVRVPAPRRALEASQ